jgi:hypothetical protein
MFKPPSSNKTKDTMLELLSHVHAKLDKQAIADLSRYIVH